VVTSLRTFIGPEGDLSEVSPGHCYRMELEQPILSLRQMSALKRMDYRGWHANVIDTTFDKSLGEEGIQKTLRRVCQAAERAIAWGYQILVRPSVYHCLGPALCCRNAAEAHQHQKHKTES
jgi:glutamate synthase (NADH)